MICFNNVSSNFRLLPSDIDGSTLPSKGAPNHFVEMGPSTNTTLSEFDFHVVFVHPKKSTFKGPHTINVPLYYQACGNYCIPQPNGGQLLDSLSKGLMFRNAYRNFGDHESLVFSHAVTPGGNSTAASAERWYELRATPAGSAFKLYQAGTLQNQTDSYWMGAAWLWTRQVTWRWASV